MLFSSDKLLIENFSSKKPQPDIIKNLFDSIKGDNMKKIILLLFFISLAGSVPVLMLSCGSGGGGAGGGFDNDNSSPGSVALYVTDSLSKYKRVAVTINSVQLVHIGSGASCDVLTTPVTLDITDLASVLQLLDVTTCPAINFNRIIIEFDKRVLLTDESNTTANCKFSSYKEGNSNPNILLCNGNTCSISISGAVNVISKQNSDLALDFDLAEFVVTPPFCDVTMKVSPLSASDFDARHDEGDKEVIAGFISELNTIEKRFTLTADSGTFTVTYADVKVTGLNDLLTKAAADKLKVKVETSIIDLNTLTIAATALYVEVEGYVSALNTVTQTFTLTYQTSKTIPIDYQAADIEGSLSGDASVGVKLNGFDGTRYLSAEVEVK